MGELIDLLVEMAQLARKNGLLALEEKANEVDDMFFKQGIMLIVDATEPEEVRGLLENYLYMPDGMFKHTERIACNNCRKRASKNDRYTLRIPEVCRLSRSISYRKRRSS